MVGIGPPRGRAVVGGAARVALVHGFAMTHPATLLRRFWPACPLALLAVAAHFQARAVTSLLGSELVDLPKAPAHGSPLPPAPASPPPPSGDAVLARNPFDSKTGPLLASGEPEARAEPEASIGDPLTAPKCTGTDVEITTESPDPRFSLAVLRTTGEKHGRLRRVGDDVGDKRVAFIGYNPLERSPAVWLEGNGELCQSVLFAPKSVAPTPKAPPRKPPATKPRPGRQPASVPPDIAKGIQKLSDNELNVDRNVVDKVMDQYRDLMKGTVVKPVVKNGQLTGMQLNRVQPTSLLAQLGLRNGDVVRSINGFPLTGPEKALQAYARLRTASEIHVQIERGGKPQSVDLHIR